MPYIQTRQPDPDSGDCQVACLFGLMSIDGLLNYDASQQAKEPHHLLGLFESCESEWYEEWKKEVLSYFPVKYEHPWVTPECNYKTLHLLIILLRQPIEDGTMEGLADPIIIERKGDPLQSLLHATKKDILYGSSGHGVKRMLLNLEAGNIPIERISLKKAVEDLSKDKSKLMINDLWSKDVRIGYVSE